MRNVPIVQSQVIASANLAAIPMQEKYACSVVVNFSVNFVPTNWVDLASATVTVASGATSIIPKTDMCYQYMRLVWTRTGGTGSFTAITNVQGF
jgi:hypothetical protein